MTQLDEQEMLARFIYSRSQYRPSDHTVKYSAFIPPENKRLSVFRISGLRGDEIWNLGESLRAQTLAARADIVVASVNETGLLTEPDDNPPRHANIIGWPEEPSAVKLKAIELAERASLHLR